MILAPEGAPARPDLDWLRHRTRRAPAPAASGPATDGSALADFINGRSSRRARAQEVPPPAPVDDLDLSADGPPPAPAPPPPAPPTPVAPAPAPWDELDLSSPPPAPTSDLDLSGPSSTPVPAPSGDLDLFPEPAPPAPGPAADLDLSGPPPTPVPAPSADLDLSGPSPGPGPSGDLDLFPEPPSPPAPVTGRPAARPAPVVRTVPRVAPGGRVVLTPREPTVTLTRVQSGVGGLTITAVCSAAVGDLVLGAVYELVDGTSGVLSRAAGIPSAPYRSRRPVLEAGRAEFERIGVDLRQTRALRRFVVLATSASEAELAWGGTLVLTTHGGARVEIPLDVGPHAGPLVVASVYVVAGEFVVRAELDPVRGLVRDVAQAYGYRSITWADARTPVL